MSKSKLDLINIEKLTTIVMNNTTFPKVLQEIGYLQLHDKRIIQQVKEKCKKNNISYAHLIEEEKTKICSICHQEKNIKEYYKINGHYLSYCKECKKSKERNKYKEKVEQLDNYKKQLKCKKCGEDRFYLLDFYHKDPKVKDFNISDHSRANLETLKNELDKCDVLCANCHREWHYLSTHSDLTYDAWLGE